jgi:phenylacetate-CoA ligase
MPIIRYPAGDLAYWMEDDGAKNRKFKLCGRSDEAARLGTLSVFFEDMRDSIIKSLIESSGLQFQMLLNHFDHKDELILRISGVESNLQQISKERVLATFIHEKPGYLELLKKGLIHPLKVEIVPHEKLETNIRTGKLKRIIDSRN